jgi:hypothetical protein
MARAARCTILLPATAVDCDRETSRIRARGDSQIDDQVNLAVYVPSLVGPSEFNALINPTHRHI